ncbi:GNAT family N-acetyltransferase; N-acetyltransferase [Fusobacterium sp. MFO224]|uniref:GNAT family N-acetyltransferase n=1 Tax=Fusobacterium sp. MFO224 TaxID=3378070 RepID=UPI003852C435
MIILRETIEEDIGDIYLSVHEKYVKKYYEGKEKQQWEIHKNWYKFLINSDYYELYTVLDEKKGFLGYVKYEIDGECAIINIYIIPSVRGKKYAKKVIGISLEKLKNKRPDVSIVLAYILEENLFSKKAFIRSGFTFDCIEKYNGTKHMLFIKCIN